MRKSEFDVLIALSEIGISSEHARALRRISLTLRGWFEAECNGAIQRLEETGIPYWHNTQTGQRLFRTPDRKAGALKRLAKIMGSYPTLSHYVQRDPRGCALYILRPGDVPKGQDAGSYYSHGLAVY